MPSKPLSSDVCAEALETLRRAGGSLVEAARLAGVPYNTFRSRVRIAKERADGRPGDYVKGTPAGQEVARLTTERVRSLADLIRVCQIDTNEWTIVRWEANKWEVGAKDQAGRLNVRPLFQVKATLVPNRPVTSARDQIERLIAAAAKRFPARPFVRRRRPARGYLLEIAIPDLHVGKLAWSRETGHGDYDLEIAGRLFREALESLIASVSAFSFERVAFVVGNDFLHFDTKAGTTTAGTRLDVDSRFAKCYLEGQKLLIGAVERLRQVAPVLVVVVPGNHDETAMFCLGNALECWFRNTRDVEVQNEPTARKYYQHGRCMVLWTHGNKGRLEDLPLLMATERRRMFGATVHREAHTGDKHQTRVIERNGVRVRISPALCPPDAWHSDNQFVGQARAAEAYVWHRERGIVAIANHVVDAEAERTRKGANRGGKVGTNRRRSRARHNRPRASR